MLKILLTWFITSILLFASIQSIFSQEMPSVKHSFDFHQQVYYSFDKKNIDNEHIILITK